MENNKAKPPVGPGPKAPLTKAEIKKLQWEKERGKHIRIMC